MCDLENRVSDGDKQVKGNMILVTIAYQCALVRIRNTMQPVSARGASFKLRFTDVATCVFSAGDAAEIAPQCRIFLMVIMSIQSFEKNDRERKRKKKNRERDWFLSREI